MLGGVELAQDRRRGGGAERPDRVGAERRQVGGGHPDGLGHEPGEHAVEVARGEVLAQPRLEGRVDRLLARRQRRALVRDDAPDRGGPQARPERDAPAQRVPHDVDRPARLAGQRPRRRRRGRRTRARCRRRPDPRPRSRRVRAGRRRGAATAWRGPVRRRAMCGGRRSCRGPGSATGRAPASNTAIGTPSGAVTRRPGRSGKGGAADGAGDGAGTPARPLAAAAAAASSSSHTACGRRAAPTGSSRTSAPAQARASRSALPAPVVIRTTRRAAAISRGWSVTRSTCGSTCVGAGTATPLAVASQTAEPGKMDRTWPSGPTPMIRTSNTGSPFGPAAGPARSISAA